MLFIVLVRNRMFWAMEKTKVSLKEVLKHWKLSIYTSTIGMLVGALPGAGGPVASFIAYNEAKRIVKEPEVPLVKVLWKVLWPVSLLIMHVLVVRLFQC